MDCTKCGAELDEGVETCPECGEAVITSETVEAASEAEPVEAAPEAEVVTGVPADAPAVAPAGGMKRMAIIAAIIVAVAAVIGGGYWIIQSRVAAAATPEAAAKAMLNAYANYDAKGILDNATHASLATSDVAQFEKQASDAKAKAKGQASVKNIVIGKVTNDSATKATVEVTAEWLDPTTTKYAKRTEKLIAVKQNGKWLVQLF